MPRLSHVIGDIKVLCGSVSGSLMQTHTPSFAKAIPFPVLEAGFTAYLCFSESK